MKTNLLLLSLLLFTNILSAQSDVVYVVDEPRYLLWGDNLYQNSLRGIDYLMYDLERTDRDLFDDMQPVYQGLLQQQREANIIMGVGSVATVGLFVAGFMEGRSSIRDRTVPLTASIVPPQNDTNRSTIIGMVLAAGVVGTATSLLYFKKAVKQEDVFHFMNEFNRSSSGDILELGVSPQIELGDGGALGVSFVMKF